MGCGKSTVGKNLARLCDYRFLDTDEYIVNKQGTSINEIFAAKGEEAFRDMETECIKELIEALDGGMVISTGGGMPVREQNRELLKQLGMVIYLRVKPETVYNRIKGDKSRPLLQCDDPLARIKEMIAGRNAFYEDEADEVIDVDDLKQYDISIMIKKMLIGLEL